MAAPSAPAAAAQARQEYVSVPFKTLVALSGRALATASALEGGGGGGSDAAASAAADRVSPAGGLPCASASGLRQQGPPPRTGDAPEGAASLRRAATALAAGAADVAQAAACRAAELAEDAAVGGAMASPRRGAPLARAWRDAMVLGRLLEDLVRQGEAGRLDAARRALDLAIVVGGPAWRAALDWAARQRRGGDGDGDGDDTGRLVEGTPSDQQAEPTRRGGEQHGEGRWRACVGRAERLPAGALQPANAVARVPAAALDDLAHFVRAHLLAGAPVVLEGATSHWGWPAAERWRERGAAHLKRLAGARLVPVETGRNYLARGWRHEFMRFGDYLDRFVLSDGRLRWGEDEGEATALGVEAEAAGDTKAAEKENAGIDTLAAHAAAQLSRGYMAQHPLLDQVPALASEVSPPPQTRTGRGRLTSANAWVGPAHTVTPLHVDPEHNLLVQVVGRKYVRLLAPSERERVYPHAQGSRWANASRVDVDAPDTERFPTYASARFLDCVLAPGDALFIPAGHWHYCRSMAPSASVNFWWG